jgi:molybdopterin converting factor small subunit
MRVTVLFFGVLTEVAGTGTKFYDNVKSIEHLKMRIYDDYPEMAHYAYRISVNNELTNEDRTLSDGDEIALLPPFAGG